MPMPYSPISPAEGQFLPLPSSKLRTLVSLSFKSGSLPQFSSLLNLPISSPCPTPSCCHHSIVQFGPSTPHRLPNWHLYYFFFLYIDCLLLPSSSPFLPPQFASGPNSPILTVGGSGPPFVLPLALYIFLKTNFLKPILLSHSLLLLLLPSFSSIFHSFIFSNKMTQHGPQCICEICTCG